MTMMAAMTIAATRPLLSGVGGGVEEADCRAAVVSGGSKAFGDMNVPGDVVDAPEAVLVDVRRVDIEELDVDEGDTMDEDEEVELELSEAVEVERGEDISHAAPAPGGVSVSIGNPCSLKRMDWVDHPELVWQGVGLESKVPISCFQHGSNHSWRMIKIILPFKETSSHPPETWKEKTYIRTPAEKTL